MLMALVDAESHLPLFTLSVQIEDVFTLALIVAVLVETCNVMCMSRYRGVSAPYVGQWMVYSYSHMIENADKLFRKYLLAAFALSQASS